MVEAAVGARLADVAVEAGQPEVAAVAAMAVALCRVFPLVTVFALKTMGQVVEAIEIVVEEAVQEVQSMSLPGPPPGAAR